MPIIMGIIIGIPMPIPIIIGFIIMGFIGIIWFVMGIAFIMMSASYGRFATAQALGREVCRFPPLARTSRV
jgi:hypothetical protein